MKFLKVFILFLIIFLLPSAVLAYERVKTDVKLNNGFSIFPNKCDFQLRAGTKTTKQILVTNRSQNDLNFQISAEDFVISDNSEERIKFLGKDSGGEFSLKDYLKPEINNFTLHSGEQMKFNVEIGLPENAVGSRYAVLFVQAQGAGQGQIQALSRLGTLFLVKAVADSLPVALPYGASASLDSGIALWKIILAAAVLFIIILTIVFLKWRRRSYLFFLMIIGIILVVNSVSPLRLGIEARAVMKSENYEITKDSIDASGIETGKSTSYGLTDTIGEISGDLSGTNYGIKTGYRVPTEYTLSISTPSNITMSSCTNSASGCTSRSSISWTVTTDYANGYTLSVAASTAPAMRSSGSSFPDFSPTSGTASFWSIDSYSSAFGFSAGVSGETDVVSALKDNGTNCGAGSNIGHCYRGFDGANSIQIVSRSSAAASGNTTTVNLKAEIGKNYNQPAGAYSAVVTATATAL